MLTAACLLLAASTLWALPTPQNDSVKAPATVFLVNNYGLGYTLFADQGTSPLPYRGMGASLSTGCQLLWSRWQAGVNVTLCGSLYGKMVKLKPAISTYGTAVQAEAYGLRRVWHHAKWQLWTGLALADMAELRYNPSLNNSSTTVDNFVLPQICARMELSLRRWQLHTAVQASPAVLAYRPGFAFIENYNSVNHDMAFLTNNYHWSATALGYMATSIGTTLTLRRGNTLGAAYVWQMLRTGQADAHRLLLASHMLVFTFKYII